MARQDSRGRKRVWRFAAALLGVGVGSAPVLGLQGAIRLVLTLFAILLGALVVFVGLRQVAMATREKSLWRGGLRAVSGLLFAYGLFCFVAAFVIAVGGDYVLPHSVNWPVGYAKAVARDSHGRSVVLLAAYRVQVYDRGDKFVRGWCVDGRVHDLRVVDGDKIEVCNSRRFVFSPSGDLLEETREVPFRPSSGTGRFFPTPIMLWPLAHPILGWLTGAAGIGGLLLGGHGRTKNQTNAASQCL